MAQYDEVLALYDFRSKQEFIYRTNRMREISGGSMLLDGIYDEFIKIINKKCEYWGEGCFACRLDSEFSFSSFSGDASLLGEVIYIGGGNLMMLFKNESICLWVNEIISRFVLDYCPTLSLVASHVAVTGNFTNDKAALYRKNRINKNTLLASPPCAVTPFTQVDAVTFMPISHKEKDEKVSCSIESQKKLNAYNAYAESLKGEDSGKWLDDAVTQKGSESLLAVIYIDGNAMGDKLKACDDKSYDNGIKKLREFSKATNETFVSAPFGAFDEWLVKNSKSWLDKANSEQKWVYRKVISGGDEITVVCNARFALKLVQLYFEQLEKSNEQKSDEQKSFACAGIAVFHSHAPFSQVYEIAEECCENAKTLSRKENSKMNCVDFHFCRAGITDDLESTRQKEEADITARPYEVDDLFNKINSKISKIFSACGRSNVKALNDAISESNGKYLFELQRINSYCGKQLVGQGDEDYLKKVIFDLSSFCDLWFNDYQCYKKEDAANAIENNA